MGVEREIERGCRGGERGSRREEKYTSENEEEGVKRLVVFGCIKDVTYLFHLKVMKI